MLVQEPIPAVLAQTSTGQIGTLSQGHIQTETTIGWEKRAKHSHKTLPGGVPNSADAHVHGQCGANSTQTAPLFDLVSTVSRFMHKGLVSRHWSLVPDRNAAWAGKLKFTLILQRGRFDITLALFVNGSKDAILPRLDKADAFWKLCDFWLNVAFYLQCHFFSLFLRN